MSARTIGQDLADRAARHPDRAAVVTDDGELSYGQLDELANELAAGLAAKGVERGDRVAIMLPNSLNQAAAIYGVLRAGAAFVPLNPDSEARQAGGPLGPLRRADPDLRWRERSRGQGCSHRRGGHRGLRRRPVAAIGRAAARRSSVQRLGRDRVHVGLDRGSQRGHAHASQHDLRRGLDHRVSGDGRVGAGHVRASALVRIRALPAPHLRQGRRDA